MPTMYLTTPGMKVSLESERLMVSSPVQGTERPKSTGVHLRDLERVVCSERVALTFPSLAELLRRSIPVVVLSRNDDVLGLCQPPSRQTTARLMQYRRAGEPEFCLAFASMMVEAKIVNQRRVLQRLAANREDVEITPVLLRLRHLAGECTRARSIETLRGYEGTAAGRYFEIYGTFFPKTAPFERRSRRPPHNAANAILSYCYTLLAAESESLIHLTGLDPAIGVLHEPAERRPSLALDLMEPFRAPVADAMALDLLSHGTLHPSAHFESRQGGVYLNAEGKRRFFVAYERRMEREFTSEQHHGRTTLRGEMERQVRAVRDAFLNGEPFEPFMMN